MLCKEIFALTQFQKNSVVFQLHKGVNEFFYGCLALEKNLRDSRMSDDIAFNRACFNETCESLYILVSSLKVFAPDWRSWFNSDTLSKLDDFLEIGSYLFSKTSKGGKVTRRNA